MYYFSSKKWTICIYNLKQFNVKSIHNKWKEYRGKEKKIYNEKVNYVVQMRRKKRSVKKTREPQKSCEHEDMLLGFAHALRAPWQPINASTKAPDTHSLTFLDHLLHSIFKTVPFNGAILRQNCCQPLLVGPQGRSMATAIVSSESRHQGWKLASGVGHGKDIGSCTCNEVQCSQLHPHQLSIFSRRKSWEIKNHKISYHLHYSYQVKNHNY